MDVKLRRRQAMGRFRRCRRGHYESARILGGCDGGGDDGADTCERFTGAGDVRGGVESVCGTQMDVRKAAGEMLELLLLGGEGGRDGHFVMAVDEESILPSVGDIYPPHSLHDVHSAAGSCQLLYLVQPRWLTERHALQWRRYSKRLVCVCEPGKRFANRPSSLRTGHPVLQSVGTYTRVMIRNGQIHYDGTQKL